MEKISVITVTYNAREALRATIESVLSQDYPELEYIVVDGASTDGSVETIKEHGSRITRWVSEKDGGIYDAMNKGVRMATGQYCIFMNAGDVFADATTVSRVVGMMATRHADVVYGDVIKHGTVKKSLSPRNCHKMYYCHQCVFTKRDCLLEFPFDVRHRMSADFKQSKQLYLAGKTFLQLDLPIAIFDTNGVSNTKRSAGLHDNILIIKEVDSLSTKIQLLPRLYATYLMCRLRGK